MKKQVSAILAAMVLAAGAQGVADAAGLVGTDAPALVMLEEEYYVDDPDAQAGDVYVDVETGDEYVVVEE